MLAHPKRTPAEMLAANWRESGDRTRSTIPPDSPPEFPRRLARGPVRPPRPTSLDMTGQVTPPGLKGSKASGAGRHAQSDQEQNGTNAPSGQRLRKRSHRFADAGNQTNNCTSVMDKGGKGGGVDSDPDRTMSSIAGEPLCRVDCRMGEEEEAKICDPYMDPPRPSNPAVPSGDKRLSVGVGRQIEKVVAKLKSVAPAVLEPVVLKSLASRPKTELDSASVSSRSTNASIMSYLVKRDVKKDLERLQEEEDIRRGKKRQNRMRALSIASYEDHGSWIKLWERENDTTWICPNLECEYHYPDVDSWRTPNRKNHKTRPPPLSANGFLTVNQQSPKMVQEDIPTSMSAASTYQSFQFSAQSPHGRMSIITAQTEADVDTESPSDLPVDRRRTKSAICPPNHKADWDTPKEAHRDGSDMSPLSERHARQNRSRTTRGARVVTTSQAPRPRRMTGPEQIVDAGKENGLGLDQDGKRSRDRRVSLPVEAPRRRATIAAHTESARTTEDTMSPTARSSKGPQSVVPQAYPQRNRSVLEELSRWSEEREEESRRPMTTVVVAGSSNAHKKKANRRGIRSWF